MAAPTFPKQASIAGKVPNEAREPRVVAVHVAGVDERRECVELLPGRHRVEEHGRGASVAGGAGAGEAQARLGRRRPDPRV